VVPEQGVVRSTGKCDALGGGTGIGGMAVPVKDEEEDVSGSDGEVSKIDFTGMLNSKARFCLIFVKVVTTEGKVTVHMYCHCNCHCHGSVCSSCVVQRVRSVSDVFSVCCARILIMLITRTVD
jgi:hypothetical protein